MKQNQTAYMKQAQGLSPFPFTHNVLPRSPKTTESLDRSSKQWLSRLAPLRILPKISHFPQGRIKTASARAVGAQQSSLAVLVLSTGASNSSLRSILMTDYPFTKPWSAVKHLI